MKTTPIGFDQKWTLRRKNKWGYIFYLGTFQGIAIGLLILLVEVILLKSSSPVLFEFEIGQANLELHLELPG